MKGSSDCITTGRSDGPSEDPFYPGAARKRREDGSDSKDGITRDTGMGDG
jgi:hypothetical protein